MKTLPKERSTEFLNVGCGPHRAPEPWWNIDRVERPGDTPTAPDEVVPDGPLPYADGSVKRLYAGHIMEHMPITVVREVLKDWRRVLAPGAEIAIVGPDVNRALEWFKRGLLTRDQLWERMEHGSTTSLEAWRRLYGADSVDPYAHHYWNCIPERVIALLEGAGFLDVREVTLSQISAGKWPLVGPSEDQFAVLARNP